MAALSLNPAELAHIWGFVHEIGCNFPIYKESSFSGFILFPMKGTRYIAGLFLEYAYLINELYDMVQLVLKIPPKGDWE